MKLLEVATVNPDGIRWDQGIPGTARECNVQAELADACTTDTIEMVGDVDSFGPGAYNVLPFPAQAFLRLPVTCERDDDMAWFEAAFRQWQERVVTRAMVVEPINNAETWIGATGVQTVTLAGSATDAQLEAAIFAAREQWRSTVFSSSPSPILHVPPSMTARLGRIGILQATNEGTKTITEDRLVIGDGYDISTPHIFWSGEIKVLMSPINNRDGRVRRARLNDSVIPLDQLFAIDTPPCSIVRVGS